MWHLVSKAENIYFYFISWEKNIIVGCMKTQIRFQVQHFWSGKSLPSVILEELIKHNTIVELDMSMLSWYAAFCVLPNCAKSWQHCGCVELCVTWKTAFWNGCTQVFARERILIPATRPQKGSWLDITFCILLHIAFKPS